MDHKHATYEHTMCVFDGRKLRYPVGCQYEQPYPHTLSMKIPNNLEITKITCQISFAPKIIGKGLSGYDLGPDPAKS